MKLSGRLPKGDKNGLDHLASAFVEDPEALHVVMAVIDTSHVITEIDTGETVPTLRVLRIESLMPADAPAAEAMVRRSVAKRTGMNTLPIDVEDEITRAFTEASTDRTTGEVHHP